MNEMERKGILREIGDIQSFLNDQRTKPIGNDKSPRVVAAKKKLEELSKLILEDDISLGTLNVMPVTTFKLSDGTEISPGQKSLYYGQKKDAYIIIRDDYGIPIRLQGFKVDNEVHCQIKCHFDLTVVTEFPRRPVPKAGKGVKFPDLKPIDFRANTQRLLEGKDPIDPSAPEKTVNKSLDLRGRLSHIFNKGE